MDHAIVTEPVDKKKDEGATCCCCSWWTHLVTSRKKRAHKHSTRASTSDEAPAASQELIISATPSVSLPFLSESSLRTFSLDTPAKRWLSSFGRSDPRWQIMQFFSKVSQEGARNITNGELAESCNPFAQASVFTVWRPTSAIAIRRMIAGEATGKGLEIKGKSAQAGKLSGYVPFLQIHEEKDKTRVRTLPRGGRVRIFFSSQEARDTMVSELEPLQNQILNTVHEAKRIVKSTAMAGLAPLHPIGRTISRASTQVGTAVAQAGSAASGLGSALGAKASSAASGLGSALGADASLSGLREAAETVIPDKLSFKGLRGLWGERSDKEKEDEREWALKRLLWDMDDPSIRIVDDYAPKCYGVELPDRLLWQACVLDSDISRPEESEYYTARPSQPAFQDMNFIAISKTRKNDASADAPRVVLWQTCGNKGDDPMDPRGLIMAYEENGRVLPVVSDFDCFTVGTRGVKYETPLSEEQVYLLQWCVSQVENVLDKQDPSDSRTWTSCWLDVLKASATKGFHPTVPRYGFGDRQSYSITECAVSWLQDSGAVRHGAECFNYWFPQELDAEFLIVSNTLPGKVPWRYVNVSELQEFLSKKVDEGFTFPLNPKWMLCDEGWKDIYDSLMSSERPDVQDSLDVWFPPDSGVREQIESIHIRHPRGFVCKKPVGVPEMTGTEAMDLATLELDQYLAFRRAKVKLRAVIAFNDLLRSVQRKKANEEKDLDGPHSEETGETI